MDYNLNDNNQLVNFFKHLFSNPELNSKAPIIIKFLILTRNYGLNNFEKNITRICYDDDFYGAALDAFAIGFKKDNIEFNNQNLIATILKNYHENGFYFHSFPGVYAESITENGLLSSNRNENDDKYYEIIKKYNFGSYFEKSENRICVTQRLDNFSIREYALFTPEWLELFLKSGYGDFRDIYEKGDLHEIMNVSRIALQNIKKSMKQHHDYDENDFLFLEEYINNIVYNRFKNGNNHIGIALIPIKNVKEYFGASLSTTDQELLEKMFNSQSFSHQQVIDFLINRLVAGEKTTDKNIPKNLFEILTYDVEQIVEDYKPIR